MKGAFASFQAQPFVGALCEIKLTSESISIRGAWKNPTLADPEGTPRLSDIADHPWHPWPTA